MKLLNDWIDDRDAETFVSRYDDGGTGWEKNMISGGYSRDIYPDLDKKSQDEVLKLAYVAAKRRLESLGIYDKKVIINMLDNKTDSKVIFLSVDPLLKSEDPFVGMDVFLGVTIHEGAHILYTDFDLLNRKRPNKILACVWNIVEDEYIERSIGRDFPGYSNYLAESKKYMFSEKAEPTGSDLTDMVNLVLGFLRYPKSLNLDLVKKHKPLLEKVRKAIGKKYPDNTEKCHYLSKKIVGILKKYYNEKEDIVYNVRLSKNTGEPPEPGDGEHEENITISVKSKEGEGDENEDPNSEPANVPTPPESSEDEEDEAGENESEDEVEDEDDEEENESEEEVDGDGEEAEAGEDDEEKPAEETDPTQESEEEEFPKEEPGESDDDEDDSEDPEKEINATGGTGDEDSENEQDDGDDQAEKDALENSPDRDFESEVNDIAGTYLQELEELQKRREKNDVEELKLAQVDGTLESVKGDVVTFVASPGSADKYRAVVAMYRPLIRTLTNKLAVDSLQKKGVLKGMRVGKLDKFKMVEASMGVESVYTKKFATRKREGSIGVLIDESGSMDSVVSKSSKKKAHEIVMEMAIVFNEALKQTPYTSFFYGHTAENSRQMTSSKTSRIMERKTVLRIFKEPGTTGCSPYNLSGIYADCMNKDGYAVYAAAERIRERTPSGKIFLFVLTDGLPNGRNYSGKTAVEHTRKQIKLAQDQFDCVIMGVGINVTYPMETMYEHYINFTDMNSFVLDAGKMLRQVIRKNT